MQVLDENGGFLSQVKHPKANVDVSIARWLATYTKVQKPSDRRAPRNATQETYRHALRSFQQFLLDTGTGWDDVTASIIEGWLASLDLAAKSKLAYVGALRSFFKFACRPGECFEHISNPCDHLNIKHIYNSARSNVNHTKALDPGTLNRLLKASKDESVQDYLIVSLLSVLGLRVSELCRLRQKDLKGSSQGCYIQVEGKNGQRELAVPEQLCYLMYQTQESLQIEIYDHDIGELPLISRLNNQFHTRQSIQRVLNRLSRRIGITPYIRPHQLRATSITRAVQANPEALRLIQKRAGHSNLETTQGYITVANETAAERELGQNLADDLLPT